MYKGIIFFGTMGSGKDTIGDAVIANLKDQDIMARKFKLGEKIRELGDDYAKAKRLYGSPRHVYQNIGQGMRDIIDKDIWNILCALKISSYPNAVPVITDGRQLNEFNFWKIKDFLTVGLDTPYLVRWERLQERDGTVPDTEYFIHDTELQAAYVSSQLCDISSSNIVEGMDSINDLADLIIHKFLFGGEYNGSNAHERKVQSHNRRV